MGVRGGDDRSKVDKERESTMVLHKVQGNAEGR